MLEMSKFGLTCLILNSQLYRNFKIIIQTKLAASRLQFGKKSISLL